MFQEEGTTYETAVIQEKVWHTCHMVRVHRFVVM